MKRGIILNWLIAAVWFANGLFCKVLNMVPRHQQIVARMLGEAYSRPLTFLIGLSEITMAIWIISRYKSRINVIAQIIVVAIMNIIEYILVPDLLLWGRYNTLFALIFISIVYYNEFNLKKSSIRS